jgi:hypothetical protein
MTTEQLKELLETKRKEAQEKVQDLVTRKSLERELAALNSTELLHSKAAIEEKKINTDKLKDILIKCEELVKSMPIMNKTTRENRKFNPTTRYGLGKHIELVTSIISGIQYSTKEHKDLLLGITGLNEDLIEDALESLGSLTYFSPLSETLIHGKDYNLSALKDNLSIIGETLGVQLNTSKLTEKNLKSQQEIAENKARLRQEEYTAGKELSNQLIQI